MSRAKRIEKSVKALLKDYPRPDCEHLHHNKMDQHNYSVECPVEMRLRVALMEIDEALALPPDPVPRRLTAKDVEDWTMGVREGSRLADALNARIFGGAE